MREVLCVLSSHLVVINIYIISTIAVSYFTDEEVNKGKVVGIPCPKLYKRKSKPDLKLCQSIILVGSVLPLSLLSAVALI